MKEFIEKLIGRLEEEMAGHLNLYCDGLIKSIAIVNELAEEYKGGWIPCSEKLPPYDGNYICTAKDIPESLELIYASWDKSWMDEFDSIYEVVAWQYKPEPYHQKGE